MDYSTNSEKGTEGYRRLETQFAADGDNGKSTHRTQQGTIENRWNNSLIAEPAADCGEQFDVAHPHPDFVPDQPIEPGDRVEAEAASRNADRGTDPVKIGMQPDDNRRQCNHRQANDVGDDHVAEIDAGANDQERGENDAVRKAHNIEGIPHKASTGHPDKWEFPVEHDKSHRRQRFDQGILHRQARAAAGRLAAQKKPAKNRDIQIKRDLTAARWADRALVLEKCFVRDAQNADVEEAAYDGAKEKDDPGNPGGQIPEKMCYDGQLFHLGRIASVQATTQQTAAAKVLDKVLAKLEWPLLLDTLAGHCHTDDGREQCLALVPKRDRSSVEDRWRAVEPLRRLVGQSYRAPIGQLSPVAAILRAARLGQILGGLDLRSVFNVLESTRKVYAFAADFESKCSTLRRYRGSLHPMPQLLGAINKAVGPDGELKDDASEKLMMIRRQKIAARKRIEEAITKLLHDSELTPYLQDDFFTVRNERYVVPMRLDGRGRVKGSILDMSASGQTLFVEPAPVAPLNDALQEIDLEEKLEIARIFRDLTAKVATDAETLSANYDLLVELDVLSAEAQLAADIEGGTVVLSEAPLLDLKDARHPLLKKNGGKSPIGNTIGLMGEQSVLIISGPNAGGKTVVLKTVGLLHLMAKAGLLLPADPTSQLFLFDNLFLEMGDAQNLSANLSTFSGHLLGLKPILEKSGTQDLVLLDELAVGTDPQTGAAIGTAILEDLALKRATSLVTTHFDALKSLAISDNRFRNGSMEFSMHNLMPTYKLILDVPGQSYGLEVAEHMGLPARILARAKEMRHGTQSSLDKAVTQLMEARDEARRSQDDLAKEKLEAESQRLRWEQEVELLRESRRKASQTLVDKYESQMADMRTAYDELVKKLKQVAKDSLGQRAEDGDALRDEILNDRKKAEGLLRNMDNVVGELAQGYDVGDKLPGQPARPQDLVAGTPVWVLPLKKAGKILKTTATSDEPIEVEVGIIKLRVSAHDVRILSAGEAAGGVQQGGGRKGTADKTQRAQRPAMGGGGTAPMGPAAVDGIGYTPQSPTNSVDLRGKDVDQAIDATWNFIDRALMRGEETVILIHGHGTGELKRVLRDKLKNNSPYDLRFRQGLDQEGGDGVTVVKLKL